jgi:hypothetical protein
MEQVHARLAVRIKARSSIYFGRLRTITDMTKDSVFHASDDAGFMTGADLVGRR